MDIAHRDTDKIIAKVEKQIAKEYKQANKEVTQKMTDYFKRFDKKDKQWQKLVDDGIKTKEEYQEWRTGQILVGKRWKDMQKTIAEDYANVDKISKSVVYGHMPEVYALNHNYATFEIEKGSRLNTS